jgi:Flp pilus assembly pilin Flp
MQALFKRLWTDESGQDTTEYVLLVALIALAVTAGMTVLAQNINTAFLSAELVWGGASFGTAPLCIHRVRA